MGRRKPADVLTKLHAKTILTSLLGTELRRSENNGKLAMKTQGPAGAMKARTDYSDAVKNNPRPQTKRGSRGQFFNSSQPTNSPTSSMGKPWRWKSWSSSASSSTDWSVIHMVVFTKMGRTSMIFPRISLTGNSDSHASDGRCEHYACTRASFSRARGSRSADFCSDSSHNISTTASWYLVRTARNAVNHFFSTSNLLRSC